jgi:hypothetical protein
MVGGVLSSVTALLIGVVLVRRRLILEKTPTVLKVVAKNIAHQAGS